MTESKPNIPHSMANAALVMPRSKRVRTGCLTCRERHLKCDETMPECLNCKKSSRECKRGVRLNFIDTQVKTPPVTPATDEWHLSFMDESRDIASEYRGGLGRYGTIADTLVPTPASSTGPARSVLSPVGETLSASEPVDIVMAPVEYPPQRHGSTVSDSALSSHSFGGLSSISHSLPSAKDTRQVLTDPQELLFMQVFVEEVGIWMDSMDPYKHVGGQFVWHVSDNSFLVFCPLTRWRSQCCSMLSFLVERAI